MNLRDIVSAVAILFVILALGGTIVAPEAWPTLLMALFVAAAILFERRRYRATEGLPRDEGWAPTDERFIDDASGRPITVWFNRATGERRYVDDNRR